MGPEFDHAAMMLIRSFHVTTSLVPTCCLRSGLFTGITLIQTQNHLEVLELTIQDPSS